MITVRELQPLAVFLSDEAFAERVGPYLLVQRPPDAIYARVASTLRKSETIPMAHSRRLGERILTMMEAFQDMWVFPLPRIASGQKFLVGRADDCRIRVDEPSVSKRHAEITWGAASAPAMIRDLNSSNGTFLNARAIGDVDIPLADGDAISFGDAPFLFLSAATLRGQLLSSAMEGEGQ